MTLGHEHSWVWMVLPEDTRAVVVAGGPETDGLRRSLLRAGIDLPAGSATADALVGRDLDAVASVAASTTAPPVAVVLCAPHRFRVERTTAVRLVELAASPLGLATAVVRSRRAARVLRRLGLRTCTVLIGDTVGPFGVGVGQWRHRRRLPVAAIVVGSRRGERCPSVADAAVVAASHALGVELRRTAATVLESGKILQDLVDPGGSHYVQRIGAGDAADLIVRATTLTEHLHAANPGALRLIPAPTWSGRIGGCAVAVEPRIDGSTARTVSTLVWREAVSFLVALFGAGGGDGGDHETCAGGGLGEHVQRLADHAPRRSATLRALEDRLTEALGAMPRGWAHGDFWTGNLLTTGGHLSGVVDWDWGGSRRLPLHDLLDLVALSDRRTRDAPPGDRLRRLWTVDVADDRRVADYCHGVGIAPDRRTHEALVISYWLDRTARHLGTRSAVPAGWVVDNVTAPLDFVRRQGWA